MPVNTKRIAKNTILLYLRMVLLMAVSLYTSRVILAELGVDDYGIYSLIGGFISLFSFISNSLINAMQRFLNVALGKKDESLYQRIYVMSFNIFILFSLFLLLFGETVGLWFVMNKLNIPVGRESAAMWVYQISLITLVIQLMRTPDNASIIAYERMQFYAYISIGEALIKLGIVFLLQLYAVDKLILYVLLYLAATLLVNVAYKVYCNNQFKACKYRFIWDKPLFRDLISFSGWSLLSNGTRTVTMQGENVLLNNYYSVAVNSARGIASQVYNAVNTFLANFQTAFRPQLTQTYAANEMDQHYRLLYKSSKFSYYLLLVLVIPISFNLEVLLDAWLVDVPNYTKEFCIFVLFAYMADSLASPLGVSVYANGRIRGLQISISVVFVVQLIVSYIFLRNGWPPYIVSVNIFVSHSIQYILYLLYCCKICHLNLKEYLSNVVVPLVPISLLSPIIPYFVQRYASNIWISLAIMAIDVIWVLALISTIGLNDNEKKYIAQTFRALIQSRK